MFGKILIANRGEIACRVMRTCRAMGIGTVAVYSNTNPQALHFERCDEAWSIAPAPAREPYLRGDLILEIAYFDRQFTLQHLDPVSLAVDLLKLHYRSQFFFN